MTLSQNVLKVSGTRSVTSREMEMPLTDGCNDYAVN